MDGSQFDTRLRELTSTWSRRGAMVGLFGGALGLLGLTETEAKHRKKKHKKKKGKGAPPSPPPTSPPPPAPVATADAACVASGTWVSPAPFVAQTFKALRSGQLTSASVLLRRNNEGASFTVQIRSVVGSAPSQVVLATTTVTNVPATDPPGPRTLTATFAQPATVEAEHTYALVLDVSGNPADLVIGLNNPCPNGSRFDGGPMGDFHAVSDADLSFATFVTA